jgi:hypothetical protein
MAPSRQVDAQAPSNPFSDQKDVSGARQAHGTLGVLALAPGTVLSPDFVLVVKHTAGFAGLLEQLSSDHPCFAVIREPIATLASWATINAPIRNSRTPVAERLDPCLAAALAKIDGVLGRPIHILARYLERCRCLPEYRVIRYETIVDPGAVTECDRAGRKIPRRTAVARERQPVIRLRTHNPNRSNTERAIGGAVGFLRSARDRAGPRCTNRPRMILGRGRPDHYQIWQSSGKYSAIANQPSEPMIGTGPSIVQVLTSSYLA